MTPEQSSAIRECATLSSAGQISFGEVVARLLSAGVERYHADYTRMETTYYLPDGDSCVVAINHAHCPISPTFSASGVESSVRQAQAGRLQYPQFIEQTTAAGCVGYFVLLTGKRVLYFGRDGDIHTEWFPGAKKN